MPQVVTSTPLQQWLQGQSKCLLLRIIDQTIPDVLNPITLHLQPDGNGFVNHNQTISHWAGLWHRVDPYTILVTFSIEVPDRHGLIPQPIYSINEFCKIVPDTSIFMSTTKGSAFILAVIEPS